MYHVFRETLCVEIQALLSRAFFLHSFSVEAAEYTMWNLRKGAGGTLHGVCRYGLKSRRLSRTLSLAVCQPLYTSPFIYGG